MEEARNAYETVLGQTQERKPLGNPAQYRGFQNLL
jgi:hypothetical protein